MMIPENGDRDDDRCHADAGEHRDAQCDVRREHRGKDARAADYCNAEFHGPFKYRRAEVKARAILI
jgi:hypothetical protein